MLKIKKYLPYILLISNFLLTLIIAWPGIMTGDSSYQYSMAKSGIYNDHHSAMMSFIWHYLDIIHQGPGLMLLLHLLLLYGSSAYGIDIFNNTRTCNNMSNNNQNIFNYSKLSVYFFALLPLFPIILVYSCYIWKDVGFAYSFLFVSMMLTNAIAKQRKLHITEHLLFWIILLYGTCAKFQARYPAIIIIIGYNYYIFYKSIKMQPNKIMLHFILTCTLISSLFYTIFFYINNLLVPIEQRNNSWEYVKIYDLAAISYDTKIMYVPQFLHTNNFNIENFNKSFQRGIVDYMVFPKNAIFKKSKDHLQSQQLWQQWMKVITKHPILYLKHRIINLAYILLSLPKFDLIKNILNKYIEQNSINYIIFYYLARIICYILVGHILMAILSIGYLFLGITNIKKTWLAFPLAIFNSINVIILFVLLFCSMAGVPRYTYIIACLTTASHIFAWLCVKKLIAHHIKPFY